MRVVLLNPKLKTWSPNVYTPLGQAYVAGALEKAGHDVSMIDLNAHKISDKVLAERLSAIDKLKVIGIGGMITEYTEVNRLASLASQIKPEATIILGGPLATTHTLEVLANPAIDYVVVGEGERTIVNLVTALEKGDGPDNLAGIAYRKDGVPTVNTPAEPIANLDDIPFPARHLLDMGSYTTHHFKSFGIKALKVKSTTMLTSRGCPYSCTFCFKSVWGHKWRARSAKNIVEEMVSLFGKYGFNAFVFNDDTFVLNHDRVFEFCKLLKETGLGIKWYCNGRVNLMTEELLHTMADAGCVGIGYGLESGNQEILDSLKKGITLEQVAKVTAWTKKAGINVTGYFIIGALGETKATINDTLAFARRIKLNFYAFAMLAPIIGTPIYQQAQQQGLLKGGKLEDWSLHASSNLTKDCTRADLERFSERAFREFTIEKRYGKYYVVNPLLWWHGFESFLFLVRKRNVRTLITKAWWLVRRK